MPLTAVIDWGGCSNWLGLSGQSYDCHLECMKRVSDGALYLCVIDNTAANGYLSSDLECVGLKYNDYLCSVCLVLRLSKMSNEEKLWISLLLQCNCCCSLLFHYAAINESQQWELCNCTLSLAVCPDSFVKLLSIVKRLYCNVQQ